MIDKVTYTMNLLNIYEKVGDSHYRSRYIRYKFTCPYFAYCTLTFYISNHLHLENLLTPFEVFGSCCNCPSCVLTCDNCDKSIGTYENFTAKFQLVVHHKDYNTLPNSGPDWYRSFGILCFSCNIKEARKRVALEKKGRD